ncbi:MAG: PKD domain-containing protein [Campylobacterota bacterium]|nr:PKD domain-containing protein [Campylobacterota bacterium]
MKSFLFQIFFSLSVLVFSHSPLSAMLSEGFFNTPPTADAGADQNEQEGTKVTLDASGSSDTDGSINSYSWSENGTKLSSSSSFSKSNFSVGTHTITLTVTDNDGDSDTDDVTITIISVLDEQNDYSCGIFENVLTTYNAIISTGNNDEAFNTDSIAYPAGMLTGDVQCTYEGIATSCKRDEPPANMLTHTVFVSSKLGTPESTPTFTLTDLEYGDFNGAFDLRLNPSTTNASGTPVMLLGDVVLTGANTLSLEPGDYYFNSLDFTANDPEIVLPSGGPVRIFVKTDFVVSGNGPNINENGEPSQLFVYVEGDVDFQTNGKVATVKGFFYVKGEVKLNANSANFNVHGGITAEGPVNISGQNGDFYQDSNATELGYGECLLCYVNDPDNHSETTITTQMGSVDIFTTTVTPILNTSGENLNDVAIEESFNDTFTFGGNLEVQDENGDEVEGSSTSSDGGKMFMMSHGGGSNYYDFGNDPYPSSDGTTYYQTKQSSIFSFSDFNEWEESVKYVAQYTDSQDRDYEVELITCEDVVVDTTPYLTGPFDAWDTFRDDASVPPTDRNISTKVVNRPFQLSLASLNKDSNGYEVKAGAGSSIDVAIYPKNSNTPISNSISYDANIDEHVPTSADFIVNSAQQDAVVGFKLCATYENNTTLNEIIYTLHPVDECSALTTLNACDEPTTGSPTWHVCHSTDNFAIRPHAFRIFGEKQYSNAGKDFNLTIKAVDEANYNKTTSGDSATTVDGVNDFNVSFSKLNVTSNFYYPSDAEIDTMYSHMEDKVAGATAAEKRARVTTCPAAGSFTKVNSTDLFNDGILNATLNYSETGILAVNVNEIMGDEFAIVDADDTSEFNRTIQLSTTILDINDINKTNVLLFNPYSLHASVEYNSTNSKSWVYMNNIRDSTTKPDMAAYLAYTVLAKNKDGNITRNFDAKCFPDTNSLCPQVNGLKLNTTFDFRLNADINSSSNVDISIYNSNENHQALYIGGSDKNASLVNGINSKPINATMYPKQFSEGNASSNLHFNIDREIDTALNPVLLTVVNAYPRMEWSSSANPITHGVTLDDNLTFIYGRTYGQRQKFVDGSTPANHDALIYYESYCATGCDNTLLPNGATTTMDDPRWFTNSSHTASTDGNTTVVSEKTSSTTLTIGTPSSETPSKTSLKYDGTKGYPFVKTMTNTPSEWLIYDKYNASATNNEFKVEFYKDGGGYVGSGKSKHDVKIKRSSTLNNNENKSWW